MPWTVQHIHFDMAKTHAIALLQPAIRRKSTYPGKAEHFALLRHAVNPELIFTLRAFNRQGKPIGEFGNGTGMVDMLSLIHI